ncbi:MAG: Uma2 family endonuclease [Thermosynechococcaceae cyanobacterium MS004]|nr:Uma2 family endonuclease [Thermosynechococcaceae cyanobacterium MS004]
MTTSLKYSIFDITYPDSDGLPMAESDAARDYLIYGVEALDRYFQDRPDVYVSGNLFLYYEQGNPKAVVSPDVFVVLGVEKKKRPSYKVWEEQNKIPDFVLEVTSKSTASEDRGIKKGLYAYLGIKEYFQYDPTAEYLKPSLQGFRLLEGNYLSIPGRAEQDCLVVPSETLGLEVWLEADGAMRFYAPSTGEKLLSPKEMAQARSAAEQARSAAEQARYEAEQRANRMAEKLRELGIDPDSL